MLFSIPCRRAAHVAAAATLFLWPGLPGAAGAAGPPRPAAADPRCAAPGGVRSLADVLSRLGSGPRAQVLAARVRAAEALRDQAATRPNPSLSFTAEDLTGSGAYTALGESETTLSLSQRIELGGQRGRRVESAEREVDVERAQAVVGSARTALHATRIWIDVLASRLVVEAATESDALVRDVLAEVTRRHAAGAASRADLDRATIAAANSLLERADAERRERVTAAALVALWDGAPWEAACVAGELAAPDIAGAGDASRDAALPAVVAAEREVDARRADVASARAQAWPDFQVGAGARYLAGPGDVSMVASLGIEVPVFDRNAGNVRAAEEELVEAQARATTTRLDAAADLVALREEAAAAAARVQALEAAMLPAAARAFESLRRSWGEGAASIVDVLEARRTLAALRMERVSSLARYHHAVASVDATTGRVTTGANTSLAVAPPAVPGRSTEQEGAPR